MPFETPQLQQEIKGEKEQGDKNVITKAGVQGFVENVTKGPWEFGRVPNGAGDGNGRVDGDETMQTLLDAFQKASLKRFSEKIKNLCYSFGVFF